MAGLTYGRLSWLRLRLSCTWAGGQAGARRRSRRQQPRSLPEITPAQAIARDIDAVIKPKNNAKVVSADG